MRASLELIKKHAPEDSENTKMKEPCLLNGFQKDPEFIPYDLTDQTNSQV